MLPSPHGTGRKNTTISASQCHRKAPGTSPRLFGKEALSKCVKLLHLQSDYSLRTDFLLSKIRLGMALVYHEGDAYIVANYGPAGNVEGEYRENVLPEQI